MYACMYYVYVCIIYIYIYYLYIYIYIYIYIHKLCIYTLTTSLAFTTIAIVWGIGMKKMQESRGLFRTLSYIKDRVFH